MAKRKKEVSEESDFEDYGDGGDSDASYSAKTRKKPARTQVAKPNKRRKGTAAEECIVTVTPNPHSRGTHVVRNGDKVRTALLDWYQLVHESRGMPWRKPFNPQHSHPERAQRAYEVWVSEIMLQQTQVATVIPYYNRWMEKFPTIADLAAANIDEVNALWKGLGYYSRASRLLAGAQKVVKELGGLLPDNAKDMQSKIPGIGRYSAGAICSIAYGEKVPVLDGNVHRLLSRFLMMYSNPKSKATLDILWTAAEAMVDVKGSYTDTDYQNPGDINQALIELGSTVCKVQNPSCGTCPLKDHCGSYQKSSLASQDSQDIQDIEDLCSVCEPLPTGPFDVTLLPMKAEKKKAREETDIVNVVEWRRSSDSEERWFLLVKRPEKGLLAGLDEFPTMSNVSDPDSNRHAGEGPVDVLSSVLASPVRRFSPAAKRDEERVEPTDSEVRISQVKRVGDVLHIFSHVRKTYRSQWVLLEGGSSPPPISAKADTGISRKKTVTKGKRKGKAEGTDVTSASEEARWVSVDEVDHANISTGMVKVWALAQTVWRK